MSDTVPRERQLPLFEVPLAQPPEISSELQPLNRYDRLDMLARVEGFLPTSQTEVNEATGLVAFLNTPGGAAKHLGEVMLRQRTTGMADPARTGRKLTRMYGEYALDAQARLQSLASLQGALADDINPRLRLDRVFEPTDAGLLDVLQDFDLNLLRETERPDKVGYDPLKVDYSPDNDGIMFYLKEAMAHWRIQQLRQRLPITLGHQTARQAFWTERVEEIDRHYPLFRPIAKEQLAKLVSVSAVE